MKFKKSLSLLLSAVMVAGCASVIAYAADADSESVGYSNQTYLESYASQAQSTNDFGATYSSASTTWKTWSPEATSVKVKLYKTGSDNEAGAGIIGEYAMTKNSAGIWSVKLDGDYKNVYYTYLVNVKGTVNETQDVYSKAVGVNGNRSMVVDLASTNPEGWENDHHVFQSTPTSSVVWEVHVRDFSIANNSGVSEENKGRYLAFTEGGTTLNGAQGGMSTGIDYLVERGVNTVQLQPVYDFGSVNETIASSSTNRNWGYDPVNYNVPEGSYSSNPYDGNTRITEFKQMVQALHDRGITVVMDVVYNHTYVTDGSCFSKTVPGYYYRMTGTSTYSNGSGCGNETASDKTMFSKYMVDSVKYWADEYHIDGFRFDLMALHDTTTMGKIRTALDGTPNGSKILMYGEPWTGGTSQCPNPCNQSHVTSLDSRIGMFNDTFRDAIKGSTDGADGGFLQGSETNTGKVATGINGKSFAAKAPSQTIAYADAHDNLILWDKLVKSNGGNNYTGTDAKIQNQLIGGMAILTTSKGIPFMTAGTEMGRTKKGDTNSYKSSDDINQIDWSRANTMKNLPAWYKMLVALRTNVTAINSNSFVSPTFASQQGHVIAYTYNNNTSGEWSKVCVLYNNDNSAYTISNLGASSWKVVGNSVAGSSVSATGANIRGIADFNGSSISVPGKGTIVLINNIAARTVSDSYGTLTVRHQTESGTVLKTQNAKYRVGNTYRALPDSTILFSRRLVNTTGTTSGTVQADGNYTVTFTYSDQAVKDGYITVQYKDSMGKVVKDSSKTHYKEGDKYNVTAPSIQGYELDTDKFPAGTVGTFDGNDKTITFTYKALSVSSTKVHYQDNLSASNVWMYAYKEDGTAIFGTWDAVVNNSQARMTKSGNEWVGTIPAGSAYVIFRTPGGKQEPGQGEAGYLVAGEAWIKSRTVTFTSTVKTSHIDLQTGQKIAPDVVKNASSVTSSDTYTTAVVTGRDDAIVPGNAQGTYTPGVINVVYFYNGGIDDTKPTTEPITDDPTGLLMGDANLDDEVTIADVTTIQMHLAEIAKLTGDALKVSDVNGDNRVSIKDVTCIQKYLAEYTSEIGVVGRRVAVS